MAFRGLQGRVPSQAQPGSAPQPGSVTGIRHVTDPPRLLPQHSAAGAHQTVHNQVLPKPLGALTSTTVHTPDTDWMTTTIMDDNEDHDIL